MNLKSIIVFLFILMMPGFVLGQGKMSDPRRGGLLMGGSYNKIDGSSSGLSIIYGRIIKKIEIGVEFGKYSSKNIFDNTLITYRTIYFQYYFEEEFTNFPFSFSLNTGFTFSDNASSYVIGFTTYKKIKLYSKGQLQPYAGYNYMNTFNIEDKIRLSVNMGLSYIIEHREDGKFFIHTGVSWSRAPTMIKLTLGFVLPKLRR